MKSPVPSALFRPNCKQFELPRRAERREPSRLGAEQFASSEYLPPELGPGQLVFDARKFACLCHHRVQERMRLDEPKCKFDSIPMRNLI